ncbi:hypothetical protein DFJ58DRAFT_737037 [Suillus subalutaceus]|uniref:uncharacterized protein n=1 Tax=Suillus subalutaceus TaxID=48586 RepID=UPI001B85D6E9|nr:uncharacterized protein DFJ58DRAFT_737037 [Suillus subalutaceus]KAG1830269.1 hypothetical protein DFJ58DRAFT_737037 [Suillus subalutaceus]
MSLDQILRVDKRKFAVKMLRAHVDVLDDRRTLAEEGNDDDEVPNPVLSRGHIKLAIQDIENHSGQWIGVFQGFHKKFSDFINNSLPTYGYRLERWVTIPTKLLDSRTSISQSSLRVFRRLEAKTTDYLRCTPSFHGTRAMTLLDVGSFEFALVPPFTAGIGASRRWTVIYGLTRVKGRPRASSIFIPVQSFIRGAVCFPDPDHRDEFLVVDHIDSDMFVRMKSTSSTPNYNVQISPLSHISNDTAISSSRTMTSGNVLQTALCYLEAIHTKVPELVSREKGCPGSTCERESAERIVQGEAINGLLDTIHVNPLTLEAESTFAEPVFDAEKVSLHQYSALLSHISNDTAISSAHTMHCSAPLSHIYELMQGLELAKTLLCRENLKRDYTQQTLQVWDKHLSLPSSSANFPRAKSSKSSAKFDVPFLANRPSKHLQHPSPPRNAFSEDEELSFDKERVAKKPKRNVTTGMRTWWRMLINTQHFLSTTSPVYVPIFMQAHVKAMQPPSAIPQMRISSNGAMRPPVVGNIASPSSPTVVQQQPSPPCAASTNGVNGNHAGTPTSDGDSVRLIAAPNGIAANNTATLNGTAHQSTDSNQAGSPARPKAESQHVPVSVPLFIVMPQAGDSSDDFAAELDAIEDTDELDTLRTVLTIPQPDVPMHEVRKALELAQQAYTVVRSELRALKKDHAMLQAAIPARSRN